MKELIEKYTLQNAIRFNGKANIGAVIGKVLKQKPELKTKIKDLAKEIKEVVKRINQLSIEEQKKRLQRTAPELLKKKIQKRELPELKNAVKGKVTTRLPPEPSKYNHIGHALSFLLNYLYAKKYNGRCILRFEDTNPVTSKQEYVNSMKEDVLKYLDIKPDKTVFASDDMGKFYKLAEKLIKEKKAYVCKCDRETMQKLRNIGEECECRKNNVEKNIELWNNMLGRECKEGEATLRLAIDMSSKNYVMRDPVMFRISYAKHYKQKTKYCVWPLYDFENTIEDELCNITHILRSSEFGEMRIELQNHIKDLLNFKKQTIVQYGRFNIKGAVTQGRKIRELIEQKKVIGWDDPSLVTLKALKRRGFVKETFYELALEVGLSPAPTNIDWSIISSINRSILDSKCNRYFFINDPIKIKVQGAPKQKPSLKLHPDFPKRGKRIFGVKDEFYITRDDYKKLKDGKLNRLMNCLNFVKKGNKFIFDSLDYEKFREKGDKIIHWLPVSGLVKIEILMPDKKMVKGLAENHIKKLKIGDVVQFMRFGFCRLDSKNKFWFTHR